MSISLVCECGRKYTVKVSLAGRKFRCQSCNRIVAIPSAAEPVADEDDLENEWNFPQSEGDPILSRDPSMPLSPFGPLSGETRRRYSKASRSAKFENQTDDALSCPFPGSIVDQILRTVALLYPEINFSENNRKMFGLAHISLVPSAAFVFLAVKPLGDSISGALHLIILIAFVAMLAVLLHFCSDQSFRISSGLVTQPVYRIRSDLFLKLIFLPVFLFGLSLLALGSVCFVEGLFAKSRVLDDTGVVTNSRNYLLAAFGLTILALTVVYVFTPLILKPSDLGLQVDESSLPLETICGLAVVGSRCVLFSLRGLYSFGMAALVAGSASMILVSAAHLAGVDQASSAKTISFIFLSFSIIAVTFGVFTSLLPPLFCFFLLSSLSSADLVLILMDIRRNTARSLNSN